MIVKIDRLDGTLILNIPVPPNVAPESACCISLAKTTSCMVQSLTDWQSLRSSRTDQEASLAFGPDGECYVSECTPWREVGCTYSSRIDLAFRVRSMLK